VKYCDTVSGLRDGDERDWPAMHRVVEFPFGAARDPAALTQGCRFDRSSERCAPSNLNCGSVPKSSNSTLDAPAAVTTPAQPRIGTFFHRRFRRKLHHVRGRYLCENWWRNKSGRKILLIFSTSPSVIWSCTGRQRILSRICAASRRNSPSSCG
jgi:hypothetical protein